MSEEQIECPASTCSLERHPNIAASQLNDQGALKFGLVWHVKLVASMAVGSFDANSR